MGKQETYRLINIDKAMEPSVFEKETWNAAIEAAALKSISAIGYETKSSLGSHVACEIRKLKK